MIEDRVDELRVRLRISDGGNYDSARSSAERFTRAVLERCAAALESRFPGRIVLVRRLPIRWRLSEAALSHPSAVARCAEDLFAALTQVVGARAAPSPDDDVAVFEDEDHWRACHLVSHAAGDGDSWPYAALKTEGSAVDSLCAAGPQRGVAVLMRLASEGALIRVLTALAPAEVAALRSSLLEHSQPDDSSPASADRQAQGSPSREHSLPESSHRIAAEQFVELIRTLPASVSKDALGLAAQLQARWLLGPHPSETDVRALITETSVLRESTPEESPCSLVPGSGRDIEPNEESHEPEASGTTEESTRFAGLFYLLNCALELEVGEILWQVCLPEGDMLAAAAAALLGSDGGEDPAPALFGGVTTPGLPAVSSAQQEEISASLLTALAAALPRRGLADFPEVVISLAGLRTDRLLVATSTVSPFVLFARRLPSLRVLPAAARVLVGGWPRTAPPIYAEPALAAAIAEERIVSSRTTPPPAYIPPTDSPALSAVSAQIAGVLCELFRVRTGGGRYATPADFVCEFLKVPGRLLSDDAELTVYIPAACVDLRVRRAGLDRDPDWVPWLRKKVRFVFEEEPE